MPPHVDGADGGVKGLFSHMLYSVDKDGPSKSVRHHHLSRIFQTSFIVQPDAPNANYVAEFGDPCTIERFEKMLRFLKSNLNRFGNQTSNAWNDCLEKWSIDHDWLIEIYGSQFGYKFE